MNTQTTNNVTQTQKTETREFTLGEALQFAKRIRGEHAEKSARARGSVMYVEGEEAVNPAFTFAEDDVAVERAVENVIRLKTALALANARLRIEWDGGKIPLTEAVLRQQELKGEIVRLKSLSIHERDEKRPSNRVVNGAYVEVELVTKHRSRLSERDRTNRVEALQKRLDSLIAAVNRMNGRSTIRVELLTE